MTPSFDGAHVKVAHAFHHMQALHDDMDLFFKTHTYGIGGRYQPDAARIDLYATALGAKFPVSEWGVRIGDCLHNLRSALDHVVWQLALMHLQRLPTEKEARAIQFPIENTLDGFKSARVRPFLSTTHLEMIDQYQPYKTGDRAPFHKLAILRELSNTDKHRVVHPAAVVPHDFDLEFTDTSGVVGYDELVLNVGEPLKEDTPMGHVSGVVVDRPDPKMEAEGPLTFGVVFDVPTDPVIDKAPVIQMLSTLGEITDGIVGWISRYAVPGPPRE